MRSRQQLANWVNTQATNAAFTDRYQITSTTGRIWNRTMLRKFAIDRLRMSSLPMLSGSAISSLDAATRASMVDAALGDDKFMMWHRGEIPTRVVEAIEQRAWERLR